MKQDLAALHRAVIRNQAGGRIIWQPRIGCWYDDKLFADGRLPKPWTGMSPADIFRELGCSARLYEFNSCFRRLEHPSMQIERQALNETDTEHRILTPVGRQTTISRKSPHSQHELIVKWEIESDEELKVATWREENAGWEWDEERYQQLLREVGDLGAPTMFMPRMNVQCLYIEKMGVERAVHMLYTNPQPVERFFEALEENHSRLIDVINTCPIEIINFGENVHAGTLSPPLFEKYHLPACQRRCEKLHAAGKFVTSHWDGDTAPLLRYARDTGLDGIEAITPRPQGDVTLAEAREALGEAIYLLDGIPAVYFDDIYPVEQLVDCVREIISLFAPRLILGISDEISSTGDIERIRIVGEIVDEYNAECDTW